MGLVLAALIAVAGPAGLAPAWSQSGVEPLSIAFHGARTQAAALRALQQERRQAAAVVDARRKLEGWLDFLSELAAQPRLAPADLAASLVEGLAAGQWQSLILGETHSVKAEQAFARSVLEGALARRVRLSGFMAENFTFEDTAFLKAAGVPTAIYRNQFEPEADIDKALRAWGKAVFVSYTGHAHSCDKVKDYLLYNLQTGKPFGYGPGLKDMPTVEDSLVKHGRKPVIATMTTEEGTLSTIQQMFLKAVVAGGADAANLRAGLQEVLAAWQTILGPYPAVPAPLYFVSHPKQDNLFVGITPSKRKPDALESALSVMQDPAVEAWLGGMKVRLLESLWHTSGTPDGRVETFYDVIVHREDGQDLTRTLGPLSLASVR